MEETEKEYKKECAEELSAEIDEQMTSGHFDMEALFDACGDCDPTELLDMIF